MRALPAAGEVLQRERIRIIGMYFRRPEVLHTYIICHSFSFGQRLIIWVNDCR